MLQWSRQSNKRFVAIDKGKRLQHASFVYFNLFRACQLPKKKKFRAQFLLLLPID